MNHSQALFSTNIEILSALVDSLRVKITVIALNIGTPYYLTILVLKSEQVHFTSLMYLKQ